MRITKSILLGALLATVGLSVPSVSLEAQGDEMCLMCHGDRAMLQGTLNPDRLLVTPESLGPSVHAAPSATRTFPFPIRKRVCPRWTAVSVTPRKLSFTANPSTVRPPAEGIPWPLPAWTATGATMSNGARTLHRPRP